MKKLLLIIVFIANCQLIFAQIPHLSGTVNVSILNGTIESDLEYSNLPKLKNYSIWLNAGLNVSNFRNENDTFNYFKIKYYDDNKSSEAFQYYFPDKDEKSRFLPNKFKVNYVGKFPVQKDSSRASNRGDWKGNIAFNGKTIRATEQSAWYPILYDVDNQITYDKITYDLTINCLDCQSIYLNGSQPIKSNSANFKSDKAISLLLFAGIFDFTKNGKTNFINAGLNKNQEAELSSWTDKIIGFYENKFKMPYGNPVSYIYTTPISRKNAWLFVTYPSITLVGQEKYNFQSYFNGDKIKDKANLEFFAHELGHYYFGTSFVPNSDLRWVFLEGLTEYAALQTVREVLGEENYKNKINKYIKDFSDFIPKPLPTIKNSEIDETYRYVYVPLLITALEKEIGKDKVWNWLRTVLNSDKLSKTDYTFFKSSILKSGITANEFKNFEEKYILSTDAKDNILKIINK